MAVSSKNQAVATFQINSEAALRDITRLKTALLSINQAGESQAGVTVSFREQGLSSVQQQLGKTSQSFADVSANIEDVSQKLATLRRQFESFKQSIGQGIQGLRQPPLATQGGEPRTPQIAQRGAASLPGILVAGGIAGAGLVGARLGMGGAAPLLGITAAMAALPQIASALSALNARTAPGGDDPLLINVMRGLAARITELSQVIKIAALGLRQTITGLFGGTATPIRGFGQAAVTQPAVPLGVYGRAEVFRGRLPPAEEQQIIEEIKREAARQRALTRIEQARAGQRIPPGGIPPGGIPPSGPYGGGFAAGGAGGGGGPIDRQLFLPRSTGVPGSRRPLFAAFRTLGQYATAAAFIYPVFQAFRDALQTAVAFEDELRQIQGILPSKSLEQSLLIGDRVLQASQKYGVNVREAIVAARTFAQTGTDLNAILEDMEAAMLAVRAIGFNPEQAKELLIAVRQITQEEVAAFDVLDRISRVEAQRAVSAQDLSEAIKGSAPLVRQLSGEWSILDSNLKEVRVGYKGLLDEIDIVNAATSQLVENTRVTGRQAATSLRFILARLGRPEVVESIQEITGIGLGTRETGGQQLRPVLEILRDLSTAYQDLVKAGKTGQATQLLTQIAGARQINAASVLLTNFERFVETAELSALSFGDTQIRLALQLDTTLAKLTQLGNAIRTVGIELQQGPFGAGIKAIITGLTKLIEFFGSFGGAGILGGIVSVIGASKLLTIVFTGLFGVLTKAKGPIAGTVTQLSLFATTTGGLAARWKAFTTIFSSAGFLKVLSPLVKFLGPTGVIITGLTAILGLVGLISKIREKRENQRNPFGFQLADLSEADINQYRKAALIFQQFRAATEGGFLVPEKPGQTLKIDDFLKEIDEALKRFITTKFGEKFTETELREKLKRTPDVIAGIFQAFRDTPALKAFVQGVDEATKTLKDFEKQAYITHAVTGLLGQAVYVNTAILHSFDQQVVATVGSIGELIKTQVQTEKFQKKLNDTFKVALTPQAAFDLNIGSLKKHYEGLFNILGGAAGNFGNLLIEEAIRFSTARQELLAGITTTTTHMQGTYGDLLGTATNFMHKLLDIDAKTVRAGTRENELLNVREQLLGRIADKYIEAARIQQRGGRSDLLSGLEQTDKIVNFLNLIDRLFGTAAAPGKLVEVIQEKLGAQGVDPGAITKLIEDLLRYGESQRLIFQKTLGFIPKFKDLINDLLIDLFVSFRTIDLNAQAAERLGLGYDKVGESYRSAVEFGKRFFTIQADIEQQILKTVTQMRNLEDAATTRLPEGGLFKGLDKGIAGLDESLQQSVEELKEFEKEQQSTADAAKRQRARLALEAGDAARTLSIALSLTGPENLLNILDDFKLLATSEAVPETQRSIVDNLLTRFNVFFADFAGARETILNTPGFKEALQDPLKFAELLKNAQFKQALDNFILSYKQFGNDFINEFVPIWERAEFTKRLRTLTEDQSIALFEGLTESFAEGQKEIARAQLTLQNYGQTASTVLGNELALLEKNRDIELQTRAATVQARRELLIGRQQDASRRLDRIEFQFQLEQLDIEQQVQNTLTQQNFEKERYLTILQAAIDAELELRNITQSNLEIRIAGLKELLSDYEALTQGGALKKIFEPLGKGVLTRQIDLLIQNLFDPTRGIFKKVGEILGQTGEQEALRQAQLLRDRATAETLTQTFDFGATTTSTAIINAFQIGSQLTFDKIVAALGGRPPGQPEGTIPPVDMQLGPDFQFGLPQGVTPEVIQFFHDLPGLLHAALPTGVGAPAPTRAAALPESKARLNQVLSQLGTISGFFAGTALGGGGTGAQIGSQVGGGAGLAALQALSITSPILSALLPFGGALLGGLFGKLFGGEEEIEQAKASPLEVIARNTGETVTLLENTNQLLQAQGLRFNVPTGFNLPAFNPTLAGASTGPGLLLSTNQGASISNNIAVEVNINGAGLSGEEIGKQVANAVASRLNDEYRSSGRFIRRVG